MNKKECKTCKSYKAFYTIYNGTVQDTGQGECTARIKIVALEDKCHLWRKRKADNLVDALDGAIENINAVMQIYEGD